ncbi:GNAT family N-acetyltransferase [Niveibacterium sp.]|uniref:GNAT family N-acetyltransferase n=1 Tax=Niveibacterium sp. TaxID=2017444 RepID=UPI0035AEBCF8
MEALKPAQFAALLPMLQQVPINHLFARSVLEHKVDGRVWVHRDASGAPALVWAAHPYGMSLLFGDAAQASPAALQTMLRERATRSDDEWLQCGPPPLADALVAALGLSPAPSSAAPGGDAPQLFTRTNFRFDAARYPQARARFRARHPVVEIDAALFERIDFSVAPRRFWRDAAQFQREGTGYCSIASGQVAACAFASFVFDDQLEIGIETHPDHRHQGHALTAAIALIDHCLQTGLTPVWSCRKQNAGSWRLAQRLGFVPIADLPYLRLQASGGASDVGRRLATELANPSVSERADDVLAGNGSL